MLPRLPPDSPPCRAEVVITNALGLHARPAAAFVKCANRFRADVWLTRDGMRVNGKSIMGVLMLAAPKGTRVLIETEGHEAPAALAALVQLVAAEFQTPEPT